MIDQLIEAAKRVRPACARILRNYDASVIDDVIQTALLHAYRKRHQFDGRSQVGTWFHIIATREALVHLRRNRHEIVEINESMRIHRLNPEEIFLRKERNGRLVDAVLGLPHTLRTEALLRSEGNGPRSNGTRKSRAFRMRRELRQRISGA